MRSVKLPTLEMGRRRNRRNLDSGICEWHGLPLVDRYNCQSCWHERHRKQSERRGIARQWCNDHGRWWVWYKSAQRWACPQCVRAERVTMPAPECAVHHRRKVYYPDSRGRGGGKWVCMGCQVEQNRASRWPENRYRAAANEARAKALRDAEEALQELQAWMAEERRRRGLRA